jgi:hypothetical protein
VTSALTAGGRSRAWRSPSRYRRHIPASSFVSSLDVRWMGRSSSATAACEHAYTTKAQPVPQIARIGAASAGPAMRQRLLPADAIDTAPMSASRGTVLATAADCAGPMNPYVVPSRNAIPTRTPGVATPLRMSAAIVPPSTAITDRITTSRSLRSNRSATTPATGENSNMGMKLAKKRMPSHDADLSVMSAISAWSAMNEIQ